MKLRELKNVIAINIDEALEERFMDSEELYVRFLKKLAEANEFAEVERLARQENWPEALRKAHNLKGVCASLGLVKLTTQLAELVKLLRSESFTLSQLEVQLAGIRPEWEKTLEYIKVLS